MNFEIIDNCFQVCVLLLSAAASYIAAFRLAADSVRNSRMFLTLAFGYTSFMMGTLFFVLHIVILSYNAKIFYVSEISWTAAYMFFLSLALMREKGNEKKSSTPLAWIPVIITALVTAGFVVMYGASLMGGLFTFALAALSFMAVRGIHRNRVNGASCRLDVTFLIIVALQGLVYIVSAFTHDYTRFNLYFTVDISLTLTLTTLIQTLYSELHDKERDEG